MNLCTNSACPKNLITAVVTQPDPEHLCWVSKYKISYSEGVCDGKVQHGRCQGQWKPSGWTFYSKDPAAKGSKQTFFDSGDVLDGSQPDVLRPNWKKWKEAGWTTSLKANAVTKTMLQKPFRARFIRVHPVCWHGPFMAMRVEIYAKTTPFDWGPLKASPSLKCGGTSTPGSIMFRTATSFSAWTDGLDGGGGVFQSDTVDIKVNGDVYAFKAFQRRVVRGRGLLTKQLVCFKRKKQANTDKAVHQLGEASAAQEQCCVSKSSSPFGKEWPAQSIETKMF